MLRKIGLPDNRIRNVKHLKEKLRDSKLLVIFISEQGQADSEFERYLTAARHLLKLSDVEFAYLYIKDVATSLPDISKVVRGETFYRHSFGIRVYRRGSLHDFRDFTTTQS